MIGSCNRFPGGGTAIHTDAPISRVGRERISRLFKCLKIVLFGQQNIHSAQSACSSHCHPRTYEALHARETSASRHSADCSRMCAYAGVCRCLAVCCATAVCCDAESLKNSGLPSPIRLRPRGSASPRPESPGWARKENEEISSTSETTPPRGFFSGRWGRGRTGRAVLPSA